MFAHFCYLGWENKRGIWAAEVFNTLHVAERELSFTSSFGRVSSSTAAFVSLQQDPKNPV